MRIYFSIVDPFPAYRADVVELFAIELKKLGLHTEWFMDVGNTQVGSASAFSDQLVHLPWVLQTNTKVARKLCYWIADAKYLTQLLCRPIDAIQCRDKYWASLVGLLISKIKGVPFVYWCSYPFPEHDAVTANSKAVIKRWIGKAKAWTRFTLLYQWICKRADHVFVQSIRMKQDMHAYGIPLEKMTPVPMGVSTRIFDWAKNNQVPVVRNRIVYLGTLAAVRKLDMVLDAFHLVKQSVPDATLMFVGDGDVPAERLALISKARALGYEDSITFTGFVPMDEAWALSASAAVCLSPIYPTPVLASASPTKLVEYLALSRPVVCNDHPEQSEIIKDSGAGLCVQWSAVDFATAITSLLRNPGVAEEMAARGPSWVAAHRTYPTIAQAVYQKYTEILGTE